ncbi:hypothetical protein [Mesorhizobium sp.]|uniref:hypothetical protein n=1 Tax=Mesorhizobium sp. TaxID=1871066 RepID=UPI00121AE75C|nr:hypothetical protein [Mesorhizobium sp.]TIT01462.1 MAG: hypothetical protein E5W87_14705 [Mesorhizobium sp.]
MSSASIRDALKVLPDGLKDPLIAEFEQALDEYRAGDWESVGVKAGKFCEIAYCICAGHVAGKFPYTPHKPENFPQKCLLLEEHNKTKGRGMCVQIPRILIALYELRNNRAIGHVSSEVSPNHMDAEFFVRGMKWVMAEFVRQLSELPLDVSHALIEAVTARTFQIVWSSGDARRILEPAKSASHKTLILLYAEAKPVKAAALRGWVEYANLTLFKSRVLDELHSKAFIHFDRAKDTAEILPPGQAFVEKSGLLLMGGK